MFCYSLNRALRGVVLCAGLAFSAAASAQTDAATPAIAAPVGEVVLSMDGAIGTANVGSELVFDMDSLMAMPSVTFTTSTTWTEGTPTFTGVPLKALLDAAAATGTQVSAVALNNYAVDIPLDSITADAPIVAYHIDGDTFSRRDKGPLWIVYPFDSSADYRNELIYGRSIWQLQRLTVK